MPDQQVPEWLSLDQNETIEWQGEPRIQSIIPAIITGVVLLPLAPFIIGAAYFNIKNTDYVITSDGLYKKTGVLSRSVQKIGFDKVQNVSFNQGVFGTHFGYGNVEISTAGGSGVEMRFSSINEPKQVQEYLNQMVRKEKQGESAATSTECPQCGHNIEDDWLACPECGERVRGRCEVCNNLVEPSWGYCPYCGDAIE